MEGKASDEGEDGVSRRDDTWLGRPRGHVEDYVELSFHFLLSRASRGSEDEVKGFAELLNVQIVGF